MALSTPRLSTNVMYEMMKIHVTGNAGSGKSTVSKELSETLGIPLHGLDTIVWKENWVQTPVSERVAKTQEITKAASWIIDGVSKEVRSAADFIVFLDRNPLLCALRATKRNIPYLFRSRPGFPDGCSELKIFPHLMKLIFRFNSQVKPSILEEIAGRPHIVLRTDSEVQRFLGELVYNKHGLGARSSPHP